MLSVAENLSSKNVELRKQTFGDLWAFVLDLNLLYLLEDFKQDKTEDPWSSVLKMRKFHSGFKSVSLRKL